MPAIVLVLLAGLVASSAIAAVGLIAAAGSSAASVGGAADLSGAPAQPRAFDRDDPMIGGLDAGLLDALEQAAADASDEGESMTVTSGWRSVAEQERLLRDAVGEYGSLEEASRWVATPETSAHVAGDAVDIGDFAAAAWLDEHGAAYGLCRVYDNEPWHFELRPGAAAQGCPDLYWDPTYDPRMQG